MRYKDNHFDIDNRMEGFCSECAHKEHCTSICGPLERFSNDVFSERDEMKKFLSGLLRLLDENKNIKNILKDDDITFDDVFHLSFGEEEAKKFISC